MAGKPFRRLSVRLRVLERSRSKVESLLAAQSIGARDLAPMYEGLFIQVATALEAFLEDLFRQIMLGGVAYPVSRGIKPRIQVRSAKVLAEVLLGGRRRFVDWLPYQHSEERAKVFLRGGRPFTELASGDRRILDELVWTRNAIAHKSKHALGVFEREVIGNLPLAPRERTPVGYLRSQMRINPQLSRFESSLAEVGRIAKRLS